MPPVIFHFSFSKVPICVVGKGADPKTCKEARTMFQSSFESLFNPSDFPKTMGKTRTRVIGYNSRKHFCPTKPTTTKNYFNWKVQEELVPILSGGLLVIEELDTTHLDPGVVTAVKEVEDCILKNLPILSIHVNAAHHGLVCRAKLRAAQGPALEMGGPEIPSSGTAPELPFASTSSTSEPSAQVQPAVGRKKGRQLCVCHICGVSRQRKPDLDGHLWNAHNFGTPIQCNLHPCVKRDFSTKSTLRTHVKTVHHKDYRYKCSQCTWGSDSHDEYITHKVRKHKTKLRDKKTKKVHVYKCHLCKKVSMDQICSGGTTREVSI